MSLEYFVFAEKFPIVCITGNSSTNKGKWVMGLKAVCPLGIVVIPGQ